MVAKYKAARKKKKAKPVLDYGITTGFGEFKDIPIEPDDLEALSRNILLSHSAGVGENADPDDPANYYPAEVVRAVLVLRLNTFLKGHSGVREELIIAIEAMINERVVPLVPLRGSVGSSGDLAPLSHLFVVLLGEGRYYIAPASGSFLFRREDLRGQTGSPGGDRGAARKKAVEQLGAELKMKVPDISRESYKEGLALTNGATFSAALLALAVYDAEALANAADVAASLSLEAVCGCARALDKKVHEARGHRGEIESAANLRDLLITSKLLEAAGAVQDVYSLRCAPQVHGAARDAIAYARMVIEKEINAATDNPLFFAVKSEDRWDYNFKANWPKNKGRLLYNGEERISYSAGNFHGEPVGFAADFLAIGLAELADISERRIQMLLDSHHNRNLPANLIPEGGINSGFMIAQYCAASIVSENKILTHPASVDSIPTSSNSEDHNAMASIAARKLRTVLHNVQAVLAIELLVGTQAIEWRVKMKRDPRVKPAKLTVKAAKQEAARFRKRLAPRPRVWASVAEPLGKGTGLAYLRIRDLVEPMLEDRPLDEDIRKVRQVLEDNSFVESLNHELKHPLRPILPLLDPGKV